MDNRQLTNKEIEILLVLRGSPKGIYVRHVCEDCRPDADAAVKSLVGLGYAALSRFETLKLTAAGGAALDRALDRIRREDPAWLADVLNRQSLRRAKSDENSRIVKWILLVVIGGPILYAIITALLRR